MQIRRSRRQSNERRLQMLGKRFQTFRRANRNVQVGREMDVVHTDKYMYKRRCPSREVQWEVEAIAFLLAVRVSALQNTTPFLKWVLSSALQALAWHDIRNRVSTT